MHTSPPPYFRQNFAGASGAENVTLKYLKFNFRYFNVKFSAPKAPAKLIKSFFFLIPGSTPGNCPLNQHCLSQKSVVLLPHMIISRTQSPPYLPPIVLFLILVRNKRLEGLGEVGDEEKRRRLRLCLCEWVRACRYEPLGLLPRNPGV